MHGEQKRRPIQKFNARARITEETCRERSSYGLGIGNGRARDNIRYWKNRLSVGFVQQSDGAAVEILGWSARWTGGWCRVETFEGLHIV